MMTVTAFLGACAAPQPAAAPPASPTVGMSHQIEPASATVSAPLQMSGLKALAGRRPTEIQRILGRPDLRRNEPPAMLWQYRDADCVLNLFFYRERGTDRLVHMETWQRNLAGGTTPVPCRD